MSIHNQPHNPLEGERPDLSITLQDGTDEQISIIIVHRDRPEYLNLCLQSIALNSTSNNYEFVVVDNGSTGQDALDYLDEIDGEVKVVRSPKNLYWSAAANKGVAAADPNSKYLVFMHYDVVVLNPSWLDILINVSESQNAGLVGTELQSYHLVDKKVDFVQEWCMLMTRECWNDIGPWPEELPMIGHAFVMTMRARAKGHNLQLIKNNIVHHYRAFSLSVNECERMIEQAMVTMPKILQTSQKV